MPNQSPDNPGQPGSYVRYKIVPTAHLHHPGDNAAAKTANSFILQYQIKKDYVYPASAELENWGTPLAFKIKFRDGPHGYNQPAIPIAGVVPRGDVYWVNFMSAPATLLDYSTHRVTMIDKPPLSPNINIIPYSGVNNKLLLSFNTSIGEHQTTPILIKSADAAVIAQHISAVHGISYSSNQVLDAVAFNQPLPVISYRNDDPTTKYEIFRITTKPTSYADFDTPQNPRATATAEVTSVKRASGVAYMDTVRPNIKYYYCFRALDVHGNFSNPTHIFEVELVDNAGQVYLVSKTFMLETDISANNTKVGRKYIYIEPAASNLALDPARAPESNSRISDNPGDDLMGMGSTCWGKTFKIRLTSKKSNKKIDLNILFKNTGVINP